MTFGMWECGAYFMSNNIQTSVVAANAFRSLMLGEDNKNENVQNNNEEGKQNVNFFDNFCF